MISILATLDGKTVYSRPQFNSSALSEEDWDVDMKRCLRDASEVAKTIVRTAGIIDSESAKAPRFATCGPMPMTPPPPRELVVELRVDTNWRESMRVEKRVRQGPDDPYVLKTEAWLGSWFRVGRPRRQSVGVFSREEDFSRMDIEEVADMLDYMAATGAIKRATKGEAQRAAYLFVDGQLQIPEMYCCGHYLGSLMYAVDHGRSYFECSAWRSMRQREAQSRAMSEIMRAQRYVSWKMRVEI